jgi:hypothetical protein
VIPDSKDEQLKFTIERKKDEVVGVITTCILREIHFHRKDQLSSSSLEDVEDSIRQDY